MIRPSSELLALSRRWYVAVMSGEKSVLTQFLSPGEHLRFVGTSDDENWTGREARDEIARHFIDMPMVARRDELLAEAYESGDTGWSFSVHRVWFEGGKAPLVFRSSLVFAREADQWNIVQRHASFGSPNELHHPGEP